MTWVKICGITNLEDALVAVDAGADAVGFVFHERSPRKVDVEMARAIVAELPERVEKVGVFVEQSSEEIRQIVGRAELSAVQIHGGLEEERSGSTWKELDSFLLRRRIWAVPSGDLSQGLIASVYVGSAARTLLIDSGTGEVPGGTGKTFDWEKTRATLSMVGSNIPTIVAGGLTSSNVGRAIQVLQPFGVDVASGVEARPGKKDPEKVRAFVNAVRQADQKAS
jgi:phosphoribosylanthranilate isomerase